MTAVVVIYAGVMLVVAFLSRHHTTGDDYLMAGRSAGRLAVAASLFTLIGGGELVTLTALAYTYGWSGLALFVGYALAFSFLGVIAPRIRRQVAQEAPVSLPDYVHSRYGTSAGHLVFLFSFLAFFALLLLQFSAGGQILSGLLGLSYELSVLLVATIATMYLLIGGLRTVFATDMLQGVGMLVLMPILMFASSRFADTQRTISEPETLPVAIFLSLVISGFFVGASSADVWQRCYAAKSDSVARVGFIVGAVLLMIFGVLLVRLGLIARSNPAVGGPDSAFLDTLLSPA